MPLAGRMRLNTFLALLAAATATCGAGGLIFGSIFWPEPETPELPVTSAPTPHATPAAPAVTTPAMPSSSDAPEQVVMGYAGKDLGTDKLKDVTAGRPYKISVYQDAGHSTANRAKVDLDRDEKWDEKWTFEGGTITRQIAPADDERYTVTQHWDGVSWSGEGAAVSAAPAAPADPVAPAAPAGRPVDQFLLARAGKDLGTDKVKDATKGRPYKVNLYQDAGHSVMNRAKVDLDRDDRWDEKWTFDGDRITRQVSEADDEQYGAEQTWTGTGWQ